jgi:hypothetical protein
VWKDWEQKVHPSVSSVKGQSDVLRPNQVLYIGAVTRISYLGYQVCDLGDLDN